MSAARLLGRPGDGKHAPLPLSTPACRTPSGDVPRPRVRRRPNSTTSPSWPRKTRRSRAKLEGQLAAIESRLAELEEARLFSGEYDSGDAVVTVHAGAGGTDFPGLGRDPPAHVPALVRTAPLRRRDGGGLAGGGSRPEVGDLHRSWRERLRPLRRRARRPPPGPDQPLRLLLVAAIPASPRLTSARWWRATCQRRYRRVRPADRHLPRLRGGRPARQQDRLRGADHPSSRPTPSSSARTSARRPRTRRSRCSS